MSNSNMMAIISQVATTVYKDVSHKDRTSALLQANEAKTIVISDNSALLRVTPTWHNIKLSITKGRQAVPTDVLEWRSFQALVRKGLISIVDQKLTDSITQGKEIAEEKPAKAKTKKTAEDIINSYDPNKGPVRID